MLTYSTNGKIRIKKIGVKTEKIVDGKDEGIGSWLYVT